MLFHIAQLLNTHIKVIERLLKVQRFFGIRLCLVLWLLIIHIVYATVSAVLILFTPATKSFQHLYTLRPDAGYTGSYTQHRQWVRKLQIGTVSSTIVMICAVIINGVLITNLKTFAATSFTSTQTGNWNVGTTWGGACSSSCVAGTDYPDSTDTAIVASGHTVTVPAATTASFATLTIAGNVVLTGNIGTGTDITIQSGGTFTQNNKVAQTILGALDVQSGGTFTHTANTTVLNYSIDFTMVSVTVSGAITTDAKGFQQAAGTGAGNGASNPSNGSGGGGAYGGYGGSANVGGGIKSVGYGSGTLPVDIGSGGGNGYGGIVGGDGGGLVKLTVSENMTVNTGGSITANGGNGAIGGSGYAGGGGSGGSVYLNVTGNISADGSSITANGGNGGNNSQDGGGGGGGRVAIIYQGTYTAPTTFSAFAGSSTGGASRGGAGSIFVDGPSDSGILTYDANNNGATTGSNLSTVANVTYTISELVIKNGANFFLSAGSTIITNQTAFNNVGSGTQITISGTFDPSNTTFTFPNNLTASFASGATLATVTTPTIDGVVTINSGITESFADVTVGSTGILTLQSYTSTPLTVNSLIVNGTLTHSNNTTTVAHLLNIQTTGNVTVGSTGSINATGKGYQTTSGTGEGNDHSSTTSGGGAAYGGYGGAASTGGGQKSVAYGSVTTPTDLGSGGGQGYGGIAGGAGGGAVRLEVGGNLAVNSGGSITANGANGTIGGSGYAGGGGSGGSVYISVTGTTTISGATLTANGGNGGNNSQDGGGGGGGRLALLYSSTYTASGTTLTAYGGSATGSGKNGGEGSVYIDGPSNSGTLIYDNNSASNATGSSLSTVSTVDYTVTELQVSNGANIEIPSGSSITSAQNTFNNVGTASTLTVSGTLNPGNASFTIPENLTIVFGNASTLFTVTNTTVTGAMRVTSGMTETINDVTIDSGATLTMGSFTNLTSAWSLTGGVTVNGTLTHLANTTGTLAHKIKLNAASVSIGASGSIDVDGKGYPKTLGSGAGGSFTSTSNNSGAGGGHGGAGGNSGGGITGGSAYDSAAAPVDLGSGGGNGYGSIAGGAGGGAIEISTTGTFTLAGSITADGTNGSTGGGGYAGGGGAGGSIYLNVAGFTGAGSLTATGGVGGNAGSKGGGGGGGRISVSGMQGANEFTGTHGENGGSATSPAQLGATGTYYEGNIIPVITVSSMTQQTNDGYVNINYTITDGNTDLQNLNQYEYSTDNATWNTMIAATGDAEHQGVSGLSSSAVGAAHTFVWDACSNIGGIYDATVYTRLRANDGTVDSATSTSNAFAVDCAAPTVSSVTAAQNSGAGTVVFGYALADDTTTNLTVALDIDNNGGSGDWSVADSTVSGNVGSAQSSGSGKTITWTASADASGIESSTYQVRLRATDQYQNVGSYVQSSNFALDTKDPVGLANLTSPSQGADQIALAWSAVSSEANFDHYEIWYGTTAAQVDNRTGTEWDNADDAALLTMATTSTTITGLTPATTYYFKIWAVDDYGHEMTIARIDTATTGVIPNTPTATSPTDNQTGLAGIPTLTASSYGSTINSTHLATEWQISDDGTFSEDCSDTSIVWCKLNDTTNKTSIAVNSSNGTFQNVLLNKTRLTQNSFYYCRFRYISDTNGQSSWSSPIRFGIANDAPVYVSAPDAQPRTVTLQEDSGTVTSFDLDELFTDSGDSCTYSIVDNPTPNIITVINNITNVVTFTPAKNYNGSDNITFRCTDSQGATVDSENIALIVSAVNDPPTGSAGADITMPLNQNEIRLSASGNDVDGDILTYSWEIIEDRSNLGGCGLQDFNSATPLLKIFERIASGYTCTIRLTISDGEFSVSDEMLVNVAGTGETDAGDTIIEERSLPNLSLPAGTDVTVFNLNDYFSVTSGSIIEYRVSGNQFITVTISDDGTVTFDIPEDFVGTEEISFTLITDNGFLYFTNPIIITVEEPLTNNDVLCGTTIVRDIKFAEGGSHGRGTIRLYNSTGTLLRKWASFEEAGVIPRLTTINDAPYIFAIKHKVGTTLHIHNGCGRVIKKKRLSPQLHWRRFAIGNLDNNSATKEIVVATHRNNKAYLKIYSFNPETRKFKLLDRIVYEPVKKRGYSISISKKTIQLFNRSNRLVYKWKYNSTSQ